MLLFSGPGLYLAITGLGAGGGKASSTSMADTSNGVLYGFFVFSAFLVGPILNIIGPRWTSVFGITGYPVYIGALWYYDETGHEWFPILAGAYLGITAGCLWTTAGFIANAYPEESYKGRWRSVQWVFNMSGACVGGIVALGINWNATDEKVPTSVYIIFIIIQLCSSVFGLMLVSPEKIVRADGTHLAQFPRVTLGQEVHGLANTLKDWRVLALLPGMFLPEVSLVVSSSLNAYAFNLRTRSLNTVLVNAIQLPLALGMGWLLDNEKIGRRRIRGLIALSFVAVWVTGVYIAQTIWLNSWKFDRGIQGPEIDVYDAAYPGAVIIYLIYGGQYGIFQNVVLWLLGSLTNDPRKNAIQCGIFVGVLSAGTAVAFGVDATSPNYQAESGAWFGVTTCVWPILLFIAARHLVDTNYTTEEGVIVPVHIRQELDVIESGPGDTKELEGIQH